MQGELHDGIDHVSTLAGQAEVKTFKSAVLWIATVGTALVLADDLLMLYKTIEFREAVHEGSEIALIVGIATAIAIAAVFVLLSLVLAGSAALGQIAARRCCAIAAILAVAVLLLNIAPLTEWPSLALAGRNYSAAWCLLVSVGCLFSMRQRH